MADISRFLQDILDAVYGEQVRGSIHDAIELINDVSEVILTTGTDVTGPTSSSTGFYDKSLYLNTNTFELWKCVGTDMWQSLGILKGATGNGIDNITKTSTAGLVDTYTITYTDGTTDTFDVTNGTNGNKWYRGTAISGKAPLPTVYPTGITFANAGDNYLNPSEGAFYHCVTGGDDTTATWSYDFTVSGGGTGSTVTWNQIQTSTGATKIAEIDIDGSTTDVYAPSGGLSGVAWGDITGTLANQTDLSNALNAKAAESDVTAIQAVIPSTATSSNKLATASDIPAAANNGQLTIQQNGTTKGTFTADQSGNATINLQTTEEVATASVSSGSVTFTGVDDTTNGGYDVYFDVTSSSTNKNPYAKLTTVSGEGTASMTLVYDTDADNGTNTAHLYKVK